MNGSLGRRVLPGAAPWVGVIALWYAVRWSGLVNVALIPAPHQATDFFMANAGVKDFTPASKYFDPSLYLNTIT